jgi:hypothetical protein
MGHPMSYQMGNTPILNLEAGAQDEELVDTSLSSIENGGRRQFYSEEIENVEPFECGKSNMALSTEVDSLRHRSTAIQRIRSIQNY